MSRASWFFNAPPSEEASKKGVDARKSSASLRRLTGESLKSNRARRWGWRFDKYFFAFCFCDYEVYGVYEYHMYDFVDLKVKSMFRVIEVLLSLIHI